MKEKEVFMAKYNTATLDSSIIPLIAIRETADFVVIKDDVKGSQRMKKVADDWAIFDFFVDAKNYLIQRTADDIDYFLDMMGRGEVNIEKLKRMKAADDKIHIEYTKFEVVDKIEDKDTIPFVLNYDPDNYRENDVSFHF